MRVIGRVEVIAAAAPLLFRWAIAPTQEPARGYRVTSIFGWAATTDDLHQLGNEPIDKSGRHNAVVCRFASLSVSSPGYELRRSSLTAKAARFA